MFGEEEWENAEEPSSESEIEYKKMCIEIRCIRKKNQMLKMSGSFLEKYEIEVRKQVVVGNKKVKGCRKLPKR